jgi:tRNA(fMet)-specific endonuclease VapC
MIEELALDSSAAIEIFGDRPPDILQTAIRIVLPLPVIGELRFGAMNAAALWRDRLLECLEDLIRRSRILPADLDTTAAYANIRLQIRFPSNMSRRREGSLLNDLWIAALCLQHDLPLLSNDGDFDRIEGLRVIHW